jgi:hypothetical protein
MYKGWSFNLCTEAVTHASLTQHQSLTRCLFTDNWRCIQTSSRPLCSFKLMLHLFAQVLLCAFTVNKWLTFCIEVLGTERLQIEQWYVLWKCVRRGIIFEVFMGVKAHIVVFWVMTLYSTWRWGQHVSLKCGSHTTWCHNTEDNSMY